MRTPLWLYQKINARWGPFDLDACANAENALCERFLTREMDAIRHPMDAYKRVYWNPPYSMPSIFVRRAREMSEAHGTVHVMLLPVSPSARWWRDVISATELVYLSHRVSFNLADGSPSPYAARDSHVIAVFRPPTLAETVQRMVAGGAPKITHEDFR